MVRYRQVKKWGNSLVIVLTTPDSKDLNINVGDMVNIEDINVNPASLNLKDSDFIELKDVKANEKEN